MRSRPLSAQKGRAFVVVSGDTAAVWFPDFVLVNNPFCTHKDRLAPTENAFLKWNVVAPRSLSSSSERGIYIHIICPYIYTERRFFRIRCGFSVCVCVKPTFTRLVKREKIIATTGVSTKFVSHCVGGGPRCVCVCVFFFFFAVPPTHPNVLPDEFFSRQRRAFRAAGNIRRTTKKSTRRKASS